MGETVLRSAYVVYDLANSRAALAQSNFNSTKENIVEFESLGAAIPSATVLNSDSPGFTAEATPTAAFTQAPGKRFEGDAGKAFSSAFAALSASPSGTANPSKSSTSGAGSVLKPFAWERAVLLGATIVLIIGGGFLL
jgi:hypothetical protein